jgi:lipopolysaccharide transport system permease protein
MKAWGLIWTMVRTDFKVRYHGRLMGFFWALLKPVVMFLVLSGVFSFVFASDLQYQSKLLLGLILWDFFADGTKVTLTSLHTKAFLIGKSRFPRWIVVVASISNPLLTMSVTLTTMLVALTLTGHAPSLAGLALLGVYVLALVGLVIGFGLATSALFLRYRDLNEFWDLAIYAGFFLAPVVYPLSIMPEQFHFFLYLWPPTPVIQFARMVLLEGAVPTLRANLMLLAMSGTAIVAGLLVFRRYAPDAAEHL